MKYFAQLEYKISGRPLIVFFHKEIPPIPPWLHPGGQILIDYNEAESCGWRVIRSIDWDSIGDTACVNCEPEEWPIDEGIRSALIKQGWIPGCAPETENPLKPIKRRDR